MGIRHRSLDGAHENTPFQYLSIAQMQQILARKTKQIEQLHMKGLNIGRTLATLNQTLGIWKRIAVAIGEGNIARIHILFRVQLHNGAGAVGLLNKTNEAALLAYKAMSYEESDYHRAYLFWKLGGRAVAVLAHRTCGTPSIDTARRHVSTTPLRSSSGTPTLAEIFANLAIIFEHQDTYGDRIIIGMTMPIDKIKLQERLTWDPYTNMILGVCREHGKECILEFRTIIQAENLVEALVSERVHMAAEVSSYSFINAL